MFYEYSKAKDGSVFRFDNAAFSFLAVILLIARQCIRPRHICPILFCSVHDDSSILPQFYSSITIQLKVELIVNCLQSEFIGQISSTHANT